MKKRHLARYPLENFDPIPLHKWDAKSKTKKGIVREDGKRPLHSNWTKRAYQAQRVITKDVEEGLNIGIRLRSNQLVIDVDPRNGGTKGFEKLCDDLLLDPAEWESSTGVTGSGGLHIYLAKPGDVPVRDTLDGYPGVEFKSIGRQVVAMGSRHPNGKHYVWKTPDAFLKLPKVPQNLLNLITRPQSKTLLTSGGQIDEEGLAKILDVLDPEDFPTNDIWQPFMMAAHHATAGAGRQAFIDWSTSDPKFSDDAELIGRRWDSCDEEKDGEACTYRSINKILRDKNLGKFQIRPDSPGDDFDDAETPSPKEELFGEDESTPDPIRELFGDDADDEDEITDEELEPSALEKLNAEYAAIMVGGKFRIATRLEDEILNRSYWSFINDRDFKLLHGTKRIERDKGGSRNAAETIKLGDAWLEWPKRKTFKGVTFAPGRDTPERLNLYQGLTMSPSPEGSWLYLEELMREVICQGDARAYDYLINWIRYLFQHPDKQAEVAVAMKGAKGVGKGTLGNVINRIIGRHALAIASPELITGRFNSHLQDCIFLFADEAIRAHDKAAESRLKNMITEPVIAFEAKGMDVLTGKNLLHIMMATNEDWIAPMSPDERRFFTLEVSTKWRGRQDLFKKLHDEIGTDSHWRGYRRFLYDMLNPALAEDWHPRNKIPQTVQLMEQKIRSLSVVGAWLFNAAESQRYPFPMLPDKPNRAFYADVRESFDSHCKQLGVNPGNMNRSVIRFFLKEIRAILPSCNANLRDSIPEDRTDIEPIRGDHANRAHSIEFPDIPGLRAQFEQTLNGKVDWGLRVAKPEFDFG